MNHIIGENNLIRGEEATLSELSVRQLINEQKLDKICSFWEYDNNRFTEYPLGRGLKVPTFA